MSGALIGKVALVTGASQGIGRACALRLAEAGADIVVNYLMSRDAAEEVAETIRGMGRQVALVRADITSEEDIGEMVAFVGRELGRIDILVSNVAIGGFRSLMDTTPQHFHNAMTANALALVTLVQTSAPWMTKGDARSKIVAVSSHGSDRALDHYGAIGASKAALEAIVRHLALEVGDRINANVVLAGLIRTNSTRAIPDVAFERARSSMMVGGRELAPEDVAKVVHFLCSPESDLIQGQTIVVDGGASLRI